jgi:tetratricopeptide (TPR) repeat protein
VVPSLTVPDARRSSTPRELEAYESVRLFVERARQRDPSFVLTLRNRKAIIEVCRKLEGMPLAIELAAARMEVLSAQQLLERLEDSLKLLSGHDRTAEPRHRSLRATLGWSHELLGEPEQVLFRRLSVFVGGWTLEAAEEVCSGEGIQEGEVLDLLSELVERSLVVAETGKDEVPRFRMLEPIRQYAQERLEEGGQTRALRSRHVGYHLALAEGEDTQAAERQWFEARPVAWLERMEIEHANLRAALSWSLDKGTVESGIGRGGREELGLRLVVALSWFWYAHQIEGRMYLECAVSNSSTTAARLRALVLNGAAWMALFQGDYEVSKALMEEGMVLYREVGDEEGIAAGLTNLGLVAVLGQREDMPLAAVMEELGELKPRLENRNTLAYLLMLEGMIAASRGDLERSVTLHEESLELFREIRDTQGILTCLAHMGILALVRCDYEETLPLLQEALRLGW